VIREARFHVGMDAPAHEFMGQIEQESRCDAGVTAFDGGQGLGQFMPKTADWIHAREKPLRDISETPLPYDPRWSIRALILYDATLFDQVLCRSWHFAYRAYNGGAGNLNKEIRRAKSCDPDTVSGFCSRKVIKTKWSPLDLCRVNCDYPELIKNRAIKYKERTPWISE